MVDWDVRQNCVQAHDIPELCMDLLSLFLCTKKVFLLFFQGSGHIISGSSKLKASEESEKCLLPPATY